MTSLRKMAVVLALGGIAAPGGAAGQHFLPPEGCSPFLTVQHRSCMVSLFWTCAAAPEGTVWEAAFDALGPMSVVTYDAEFQWLDSHYPGGTREILVLPSRDPISLSELLETGADNFDIELLTNEGMKPEILRVVGADRLTGEEVTIDGVRLQRMLFSNTTFAADGTVIGSGEGTQFFSPEFRVFFFDEDSLTDADGQTDYVNTPVRFIRPGEDGFGATVPTEECNTNAAGIEGADAPAAGPGPEEGTDQ